MASTKEFGEHLATLPLELQENIIAFLSLQEIIILSKYGSPATKAAIYSSPTWSPLFPSEPAEVEALQTLYFDVVRRNNALLSYFKAKLGLSLTAPAQWAIGTRKNQRPLGFTVSQLQAMGPDRLGFVVYSIGWRVLSIIRNSISQQALGQPIYPPDFSLQRRWENFQFDVGMYGAGTMRMDRLAEKVDVMNRMMQCYRSAHFTLHRAKSDQAMTLSSLYEEHSSRLKEPFAPQSRRPNTRHVAAQLRRRGEIMQACADAGYPASRYWLCRSLFQFSHCALVPYDWCLDLWLRATDLCPDLLDKDSFDAAFASLSLLGPPRPPEEIRRSMAIAKMGLRWCYRECPVEDCSTLDATPGSLARFDQCVHYEGELPAIKRIKVYTSGAKFFVEKKRRMNISAVDQREMEWLASFMSAVAWMEDAFPDVAKLVMESHLGAVEAIEDAEAAVRRDRKASHSGHHKS